MRCSLQFCFFLLLNCQSGFYVIVFYWCYKHSHGSVGEISERISEDAHHPEDGILPEVESGTGVAGHSAYTQATINVEIMRAVFFSTTENIRFWISLPIVRIHPMFAYTRFIRWIFTLPQRILLHRCQDYILFISILRGSSSKGWP